MKFSVVIPCHNRLHLLKHAVYTLLQQNYADWELFIFDNASNDNIGQFVKELADTRIHYERSEEFLPVTESWNRVINCATGDYITFLGDDDGLIPDYFPKIKQIIEEFKHPEILYSAIYQFIYPKVAPWAPEGYVSHVKNGFFFKDHKEPFLLSKTDAKTAVKGSLTFCRNFTYNMQAFVFSKGFLESLKKDGPIFRSSFPDYYLANVAFAKAKSIVVIPDPCSIVGVSSASVGYTLFNGLEEKFNELLNVRLAKDPHYQKWEPLLLLPSSYTSHYFLCMKYVENYLKPFLDIEIDTKKYRKIQICKHIEKRVLEGKQNFEPILWKRMSLFEKCWGVFLLRLMIRSQRIPSFFKLLLDAIRKWSAMHAFIPKETPQKIKSDIELPQVYDAIKNQSIKSMNL